MSSPPTHPAPEYAWRAHPARQRPGRAALGLAVVAALAAVIYLSWQSLAWSAVAVVFLLAALSRFYFSSSFEIDADGITARYPLSRRRLLWRDVRRFVTDDNGGYLSTRAQSSRLDAYRGLHLLFGPQRPAIIDRIRGHLPDGDRA